LSIQAILWGDRDTKSFIKRINQGTKMPPRASNDNSLLWATFGLSFAASAALFYVTSLCLQEELKQSKRRVRELQDQLEQSRRRQNQSVAEMVKQLDLKTLDGNGLQILSNCLSQKWSAVTAEATKRAIAAKEKEDTMCVVCLAQEKTHMFLPCGHRCACEYCASQVVRHTRRCPICRSHSQSIVKVFV
jgi:Zinc finger, C3HC4 type (RING finger)